MRIYDYQRIRVNPSFQTASTFDNWLTMLVRLTCWYNMYRRCTGHPDFPVYNMYHFS